MSGKTKELIDKPNVHFSKSGSPYVSIKEILGSRAGQSQINKLRESSLKITMSKNDAAKMGISVDADLFTAVAKGLGPPIYNRDSFLVSGTDPDELNRVKESFLIGKLGLSDGPELDQAIQDVVEQMGRSNPNKHRAIFYYLLVKKFNKESVYNK